MADIDMQPALDRHPVHFRTFTLGKWIRELWEWSDEDRDMYHCRHTGETMCECWKCISFHLTHSDNRYTTLESWTDTFQTASTKYARHVGRPLELDSISDPGGANGRIAQPRGDWRDWPTAEQLNQSESSVGWEEHIYVHRGPARQQEVAEGTSDGGTGLPEAIVAPEGEMQARAVSRPRGNVETLGQKSVDDEYSSGYDAGTEGEGKKAKTKRKNDIGSNPS